jgi:Tol biopolymer transport system component
LPTLKSKRRLVALSALSLVAAVVLVAPSSATFPGPDGLISFARFAPKQDRTEIFTARPDGSDVRQLTFDGGFVPDWSPNGEMIAFESDRPGGGGRVQIYLMNADGSGVTQLTTGRGFHVTPGWSPDGSSLAIAADWGDFQALGGIWIIPASDPDGVTHLEAQRVTSHPKGIDFDSEPQFSPDGSSIAFTRFKNPRKSAIHRVNVDGTGLQQLTPWKLNASDPDWSPDGQLITFDSNDFAVPGSKGDIYIMGADGSGRTRLTDNPQVREGKRFRLAQNPVWSPSGTKIMYTLFKARRLDPESFPPGGPLVMINPDGSGEQVVVSGRNNNKVDWGTHP